MYDRLTIIIPAYNEEKNIPLVIPAILDFCTAEGCKLIVVNDGSRDDSLNVLKQYNEHPKFTLIHHKINRGYGGAIKSGVEACDTEFLVTMDSDGQHRIEDVKSLFDKAIADDADMVIGSRKGSRSASLLRGLGKKIIRFTVKRLMPLPVYDLNSGMKLYRTDLGKKYCKICPDSMAYSDVICLAFINKSHRVVETPIEIRARNDGESTITIKTAFRTIYEVFNIIILFNPIRVFMPVAIISVLLGIVWDVHIFLRGNGVSVGSMLMIIFGVITLFFGAIAEQLSQIRKRDL
jgi:glycosyltransferase involved in cell wall biosynthesis